MPEGQPSILNISFLKKSHVQFGTGMPLMFYSHLLTVTMAFKGIMAGDSGIHEFSDKPFRKIEGSTTSVKLGLMASPKLLATTILSHVTSITFHPASLHFCQREMNITGLLDPSF